MKRVQISILRVLPFTFIPILLIISVLYLINVFGPLSLRHGDPDYIYLLSGATMGQLHLNVGHVDNPGTPLQIIVGIVTRVTHLIAGKGDYLTDILQRPDFYLHKVLIVNVCLIGLALFFMAIALRKYLENYLLIILLQMSLFTQWAVMYNLTIVMPEVIMIILVIFLIIRLIRFIKTEDIQSNRKDVILFSLISGLGLSIKLDYLPLVIIPLFILNSWKYRLLYLPGLFFSFLIFAFPVLMQMNNFKSWVKGLIVHSGTYGKGASNFIDLNKFFDNLQSLIDFYSLLYIVLAILIIFWLIAHLQRFQTQNSRINKITAGIIVTIVFNTLLISKHFGLHYMMPSVYLLPFMFFLIISYITQKQLFQNLMSLIIISLMLFFFYKEFFAVLKWKKPLLTLKYQTVLEIRSKVKNEPFIIMDQPYDFYFHESPLLFGWFFQGKEKPKYTEELKRIYPGTYVYDASVGKFFFWGDLLTGTEILKKHDLLFLFIHGNKYDSFKPIIDESQDSSSIECVYLNDVTKNRLFRILVKK